MWVDSARSYGADVSCAVTFKSSVWRYSLIFSLVIFSCSPHVCDLCSIQTWMIMCVSQPLSSCTAHVRISGRRTFEAMCICVPPPRLFAATIRSSLRPRAKWSLSYSASWATSTSSWRITRKVSNLSFSPALKGFAKPYLACMFLFRDAWSTVHLHLGFDKHFNYRTLQELPLTLNEPFKFYYILKD